MPRWARLLSIGTAAGAFSGLFGVGGGTVIVPLLILWLGYGERLATGTSIAAIVPIAIFASGLQAAYGNVDAVKAVVVGLPAVPGALAGTTLQQRLDERLISGLFAGLLVLVAAELILPIEIDAGVPTIDPVDYAAAGLMGVIAGIVGGLLGVGGGIVFVPALSLFLAESQIEAEATSLLAIVPVALTATWRQSRYGNVRLSDAATIGLISIGGIVLGVGLANELSQRALELAFAGLILFVAGRLAARARAPRAQRSGAETSA